MNKPSIKEKSIILKTIQSKSFIEKFILLILTVVLSGLLIPYVTTEIQRNKTKNDVIIQAQSKLLEDISKTLLMYETLLLDISWFKTSYAYDEQMHQKAFEKYSDKSVDLLAEWRVESVKAKYLASDKISVKLDSFQLKVFRLQDTPMNILHREKGSTANWQELHKTNTKMLFEAGSLISEIATEMKITKKEIK